MKSCVAIYIPFKVVYYNLDILVYLDNPSTNDYFDNMILFRIDYEIYEYGVSLVQPLFTN